MKKYVCFEKKLFRLKNENKRNFIEMDGEKYFLSTALSKDPNQFILAIKTEDGKENMLIAQDEMKVK